MKKLYLFSLVILFTLYATAQDYYIDFYGFGAASTVDSVQIENFNHVGTTPGKGLTTTILGEDVLNLTLGVSEVTDDGSGLAIYPNPTDAKSTIQVTPPSQGEALISISDNTGKQVAQLSSYLSNSSQEFTINGLSSGIYIVNVKGSSYQLSGKLLSTSTSTGVVSIAPLSDGLTSSKKSSTRSSKGVTTDVQFGYEDGDTLKYTAYSGNYATVYVHIPYGDESIFFNFVECIDVDGKSYKVVDIESSVWMAENLAVTKFNNGDTLSLTTNGYDEREYTDLSTYPGPYLDTYMVMLNDSTTIPTFGLQYNFWTCFDERNVCPEGWHVPSRQEWQDLITTLGGEELSANSWRSIITYSSVGGMLKSRDSVLYVNGDTIHLWNYTNVGATDAFGFGAIAAGKSGDGLTAEETFVEMGENCYFWTSSDGTLNPLDEYDRQSISIRSNSSDIVAGADSGRQTFSIRCKHDD